MRGDIINRAIDRLAPELAAIPHGDTGVPLEYPFSMQWLGGLATSFKRRQFPSSSPAPHATQGPWPNHVELVRSHEFVRETLDEHESLIRQLPFLSWEGVNERYEAHTEGANNVPALYTLVTFLDMPVAKGKVTA